MIALFWSISQEARIALAQFQWDTYKTKLDEVVPPPAPHHDKALEPTPDPELVREMKKPPHSPRHIV